MTVRIQFPPVRVAMGLQLLAEYQGRRRRTLPRIESPLRQLGETGGMLSVQKDLVRAQPYATEVWKGNGGVIESCLL